ncbi:aldo/keto reductase [Streptomyces sp. AK02-01A]|uniref:aldo/keto reductase n=1 Tax=Streptomyces sp. AK02-01A TaxID=3028648 RepID=UPI0029AE2FD6|nr:aldo/keto reductase [Streptomyces sp. AK02-01A]MDX3853186.1 aldo/keto reductase [Streptomyces sp. AK02-01A]
MTGAAQAPGPASFGLGCAPIGDLYGPVDPATAVATVRAGIDSGVALLDTAPKYGDGLSEQRVGDALATTGQRTFLLSTKVGWSIGEGGPPRPAFGGDDVLRSLEGSLRRLGVDKVDIVHVHDPDDHLDEAVSQTVPALVRLREEGVIKAVGAGMNSSRLLAELVERTDLDCVLIAGRYTLLEQPALSDLLPLCVQRGVDVIAAGVYNSGLLADPRPGAPYNYRPVPDDILHRALRIRDICARHSVPLRAAAMQFPLGHPAVTTVLVGAASPEEVADNVNLSRLPLPDQLWTDLRAAGLLDPRVPLP